jgi:Cu+-exporting ATPase
MVLVRNNLLDVVVALDLAKVVFRRIKINLVFALMYNIIAIPFAAGVWYPYTHMQVSLIIAIFSFLCALLAGFIRLS